MTDTIAPSAAGRQMTEPPPAPLRVGFLAQENMPVPPPVPGGSIARIVYHLATELAKRPERFDVTVCSRPHPHLGEGVRENVRFQHVAIEGDVRRHAAYHQLIRALRRLDLPHRELQGMPFYAQSYATSGLRRLAEQDPDVIVIQNVSRFVPLARRLVPEARLVLQMNCDWLRQLPRRTAARHLADADLVLGASNYIADRVREGFPEYAPRVRTLYNGTDLAALPGRDTLTSEHRRLADELRARYELDGSPLVLYVGTFAVEKGTTVLLEAFRLVLRDLPAARLMLVGLPNRYFQVRAPRGRRTRSELRRRQKAYPQLVRQLAAPLGESVVFTGAVPHDQLPAYYALADVYTMPSTGPEPFSLTVPEAMGFGLPVVATNHGGSPEIVVDGVTGRLVPPGDAPALARAFVELCRDPERTAATLGAEARRRVEGRFTWEAHGRQLASYLEELAGRAVRG
jgi:spore coat protein SA